MPEGNGATLVSGNILRDKEWGKPLGAFVSLREPLTCREAYVPIHLGENHE